MSLVLLIISDFSNLKGDGYGPSALESPPAASGQNTNVQTQFPQENFHIQMGTLGIDGGVTTVHGQSTVDANLCGHQVHLTGTAATGFVDLDQPRALVYALRVIMIRPWRLKASGRASAKRGASDCLPKRNRPPRGKNGRPASANVPKEPSKHERSLRRVVAGVERHADPDRRLGKYCQSLGQRKQHRLRRPC